MPSALLGQIVERANERVLSTMRRTTKRRREDDSPDSPDLQTRPQQPAEAAQILLAYSDLKSWLNSWTMGKLQNHPCPFPILNKDICVSTDSTRQAFGIMVECPSQFKAVYSAHGLRQWDAILGEGWDRLTEEKSVVVTEIHFMNRTGYR
jgi:hypothetical protein